KIPLPTDNLYKFMALSGIMLMLLVFIPVYRVHSLTTEAMEITGEIAVIGIEADYLKEKVSYLKDEKDELVAKSKKLLIESEAIDSEKVQSEDNMSEHRELIEKGLAEIYQKGMLILELTNEQEILLAESNNKNEIVIYKYKINDRMLLLARIIACGGIALAAYGFILWYRKLQRYQDRIVKNQAEKQQLKENPQEETDEKSTEETDDS
ncbi:MAG: hypothetical protein QQN41_11090, partial [Nitrosopumilus sp.]